MSELTAQDVTLLVQQQLDSIQDLLVKEAITALLVEPTCLEREWDYGYEGQTYPCWAIAEHVASNTLFVYCEYGFGPRTPFGMVFLSGPNLGMGMDSSWYTSLEAVFYESFAGVPVPIWSVIRWQSQDDSRLIATNLTSPDAYELAEKLNQQQYIPNGDHPRPYSVEPRTQRWW
jgi:hypothetical protein